MMCEKFDDQTCLGRITNVDNKINIELSCDVITK